MSSSLSSTSTSCMVDDVDAANSHPCLWVESSIGWLHPQVNCWLCGLLRQGDRVTCASGLGQMRSELLSYSMKRLSRNLLFSSSRASEGLTTGTVPTCCCSFGTMLLYTLPVIQTSVVKMLLCPSVVSCVVQSAASSTRRKSPVYSLCCWTQSLWPISSQLKPGTQLLAMVSIISEGGV